MDPFTIALLGGTALSTVGSVLGPLFGSGAEQEGLENALAAFQAQQEADAAARREAIATLQPFVEPGVGAVGARAALAGLSGPEAAENALAQFRTSPGFNFRFGEGVRALDQSAAARGGLFSGATGRAITRFGQNIASDEFGRHVNELGRLSNVGLSAAGATANIQNPGFRPNIAPNLLAAQGVAAGQGITGAASGLNSGIQNLLAIGAFNNSGNPANPANPALNLPTNNLANIWT